MTSGGCEILHADCIEVLQTLAENSFDALITDPPYRIIDPFAGSGTTICAAYLEGFGGLGIERNKYHAEKAQERLTKIAGGGY